MVPIGTLITWIAEYGLMGLIAIGVAERFLPLLPSYGVLVAIGISAASGKWSVEAALSATAIGSLAGCLSLFWLSLLLGEARSYRLLSSVARLSGMSVSRLDRLILSFRSHQKSLVFGAQLVPTVRLISPIVAGFFRLESRSFVFGTLAGIIVWNSVFISVGHVAAKIAPASSASELAIIVLIALIVTEVAFGLVWKWRMRRIHKST